MAALELLRHIALSVYDVLLLAAGCPTCWERSVTRCVTLASDRFKFIANKAAEDRAAAADHGLISALFALQVRASCVGTRWLGSE